MSRCRAKPSKPSSSPMPSSAAFPAPRLWPRTRRFRGCSAGRSICENCAHERIERQGGVGHRRFAQHRPRHRAGLGRGRRRGGGQRPDIGRENDGARIMKETAEAFGAIDILVNNAAIRHEAALEKLDYAHWRHTLAVILDGAYLCARAALPHLRKSKGGAIVNISGMTGQTGAKLRTHIASAKAGLEGMTRALALELAADG